jgi:hypothetical protein
VNVEEFELGMGVAVVRARTTCWCSWATPTPAPPRVRAVYWIDEDPPGKVFGAVRKFLTSDDDFARGELNLLKWYVGQWCDSLMALAEDRMTPEAFAKQAEFNEGWLPRLAAVSDRGQLRDLHGWLMEKGIDPF